MTDREKKLQELKEKWLEAEKQYNWKERFGGKEGNGTSDNLSSVRGENDGLFQSKQQNEPLYFETEQFGGSKPPVKDSSDSSVVMAEPPVKKERKEEEQEETMLRSSGSLIYGGVAKSYKEVISIDDDDDDDDDDETKEILRDILEISDET